jgi:2-methylcitrate dehydratase PrpD
MLLALRREHGFTAGDVSEMLVELGQESFDNLPYARPEDAMQARFSMQYCLALGLMQDRLTLEDFTPSAVHRREMRALLPLTTMRVNDTGPGGRALPGVPHRLHVTLKDGTVLQAERHEVRGSIHDPFTAEEKRDKFLSCLAHGGVRAEDATRLYDQLIGLLVGGDLGAAEALSALSAS